MAKLGKELMCWEHMAQGLRKRHESLCLRKPEATSHTQFTDFNGENAKAFFFV